MISRPFVDDFVCTRVPGCWVVGGVVVGVVFLMFLCFVKNVAYFCQEVKSDIRYLMRTYLSQEDQMRIENLVSVPF